MKSFKLSPKAEELLARIEAREATARAKKNDADGEQPEAKPSQPKAIVGLGPNPLDFC